MMTRLSRGHMTPGCLVLAVRWILLVLTALYSQAANVVVDSTTHVRSSYKQTQALVEDRWRYSWSLDLPCAKPRNHGHMRKTGNGAQSPTMSLTNGQAKQFIRDGLPVYSACMGHSCHVIPHLDDFYGSSGLRGDDSGTPCGDEESSSRAGNEFVVDHFGKVYVSHEWKVIYVRQPKSSSTAVLHAIRGLECGSTDAAQKCKRARFERVNPRSLKAKLWKEYFVFTFVRNPWTRLASAYTMFHKGFLYRRSGKGGDQKGAHCSTDFDTFTRNTNSMRKLCPAEECCAYLSSVGRFVPGFVDSHISDQSHCAFLPDGESVVDFIGATDTIDEDWPKVVAAINSRAGTDFANRTVDNPNGHGSQAHGGVAHFCNSEEILAMYNETTLYNIAHQYAVDVVRFGFL